MSSLVLYSRNGVVASWNKQGAYSVTVNGNPWRTYATAAQAIAAAKRKSRNP